MKDAALRDRRESARGGGGGKGGYQSHSVTLSCVDRDSYQSRVVLNPHS